MKYLLLLISLIFLVACSHSLNNSATTTYSNNIVVNENNQTVILGNSSPKLLLQAPFSEWFVPNYQNYQVDSSYLPALKQAFKKKRIEIYAGTWCGESKADLPKMLKLLKEAAVDSTQIKLIFLNNTAAQYKQSPKHEEVGKNIVRTPTYIIYNGKNEMGRIIDSPIESFEKDLLKILSYEPYQPNFYDLKL
jgi:thiol-disulfide isomerase/thioredoxin